MPDQLEELRTRMASLELKVGQLTVESLNLINVLIRVLQSNKLQAPVPAGVYGRQSAIQVLDGVFERLFVMAGGE